MPPRPKELYPDAHAHYLVSQKLALWRSPGAGGRRRPFLVPAFHRAWQCVERCLLSPRLLLIIGETESLRLKTWAFPGSQALRVFFSEERGAPACGMGRWEGGPRRPESSGQQEQTRRMLARGQRTKVGAKLRGTLLGFPEESLSLSVGGDNS